MTAELWTVWWIWLAAALVLAILEVFAPGYIFLGFAVGAAVLGVILWTGVWIPGLAMSLVVFAVASLVAYLVMRRVFGLRKGQVKIWDRDIND